MTSEFPMDQLPAVAQEVAELFGAEGFVASGKQILIGAPLAVWVWVPTDDMSDSQKLSSLSRWTERFHHQITDLGGESLGYALTSLRGSTVVISKLSSSAPTAEAVAEGLNALRRRESSGPQIRLLSVPHLQLDSLWSLGDPGKEAILVIKSPPELNVADLLVLSETAFVRLVQSQDCSQRSLQDDVRKVLPRTDMKQRPTRRYIDAPAKTGVAPRVLVEAA